MAIFDSVANKIKNDLQNLESEKFQKVKKNDFTWLSTSVKLN